MGAHEQKDIALALSFIAYVGESQQDPTAAIKAGINLFHQYFGQFDIVWGPAWHAGPLLNDSDDAMMFVVQNVSNPLEYYIVIRGTNASSLSSWIWQDLAVDELIAWRTVPQNPNNCIAANFGGAAISKGANLGMHMVLKEMTTPGGQPQIFDFLKSIACTSNQQLTFNVTGHSLGGGLAPALALWLYDKWPTETDAPVKPDVYAYAFAGPSIGNLEFAQHLAETLGDKCLSYKNYLDVVTHVWNLDTMSKIPSLYGQLKIPLIPEAAALGILFSMVYDKQYTPVGTKKDIPSSIKQGTSWKDQMDYQHVQPYLNMLINAGVPESAINQLMNQKLAILSAKLPCRKNRLADYF